MEVRPVANPGDPRRGLAPDRAAAEDASRQEGGPQPLGTYGTSVPTDSYPGKDRPPWQTRCSPRGAVSFPRRVPSDEGIFRNPRGLARRAQEWIRLHPFAARNTPALSYFETPSSRSDPTFTRSGARRSQPAPEGPLAAARAALSSGLGFAIGVSASSSAARPRTSRGY
ncbi:hypothetical protein R1flu_003946 [Riccia fluitans]|uniref:Uncharacterized protein n=1 Tax=Riccia fluitans TaxID=41844 RepID=A0ABD1YST8_9MARC